MAEWAGYDDVVAFACAVEAWTQEERREFLSQFYRWRAIMLSESAGDDDGRHPERKATRGEKFDGHVYGDANPKVKDDAGGDSSGTVKAEAKTDSSDDEL